MKEKTFGEKAVGLTFNTTNSDDVHKCKSMFAQAIDQMNDLREKSTDDEVKRMAELSIIRSQEAQMWAVKALTWRK